MTPEPASTPESDLDIPAGAPRPTFPCSGGCACGATRYELHEAPLEFHICHCTDCQRMSGSAFVESMPVFRRAIRLQQGRLLQTSFENDAGIVKREWRCNDCGARLWGEPPGLPLLFNLRPGTLDDTRWLRPAAHIWTQSAQHWVQVPSDVLRYERQPTDPLKLVRAWRSQFPDLATLARACPTKDRKDTRGSCRVGSPHCRRGARAEATSDYERQRQAKRRGGRATAQTAASSPGAPAPRRMQPTLRR